MHEKAASRQTRRRSGNLPIQRTTRGVICDSCQESSVQRFGMRPSSGLTASSFVFPLAVAFLPRSVVVAGLQTRVFLFLLVFLFPFPSLVRFPRPSLAANH